MQQRASMRHKCAAVVGVTEGDKQEVHTCPTFFKFKGISTNPEISKARASRGATAKTLQRRDGVTPTPLHTTTWTNLCQLP